MNGDTDQRFAPLLEGMIPAMPDFTQIQDFPHAPAQFKQGDAKIEDGRLSTPPSSGVSGFQPKRVFIVEDDDTVTEGDVLFRNI